MKRMLGTVMLTSILLVGCGETETKVNEVVEETPVVQEETVVQEAPVVEETPQVEAPVVEDKRFGLGETIGNESIQVNFFNAYYTDERNQYSDTPADKVLILEFEYKNVGLDREWALFGSSGFAVYDENGRRLQTYPATETYYGGTVSKGRMSSISEAFAVVGDCTHFEIEIGDAIVEFDLE